MLGGRVGPSAKPAAGTQLDWSHPLARGLVGLWLLNEGGGRAAGNAAGGRPGAFGPGATTAPKWAGEGLVFPSSTSVVTCGTLPTPSTTATLTVRFLARTWSGSYDYLAGKEQSTSPYSPYTLRNELGQFQYLCANAGSFVKAALPALPSVNVWHTVTGTCDGATARVYLDGRLGGTASLSGALLASSASFTIGDSSAYTGRAPTNLTIAWVALHHRGLSPADVRAFHAAGAYGLALPPVTRRAWFLPGSPAPAVDAYGAALFPCVM